MVFNEKILIELANSALAQRVTNTKRLAPSGSNRVYMRLSLANGRTVMGAFNEDLKENEAFFTFTRFFEKEGINVPHLLAVSEDKCYYLLTDLGDETLYSYLTRRRHGKLIPNDVYDYYRKVIIQLPRIQLAGKKNLDFSVCYPRAAFDRQSMQWDLSYFKYYFVKLFGITFDEQLLEDDFNHLMDYLLEVDQDYFLYRDFQSRNIMLRQGKVYFIDYQGGRKGALQYDIASILYDGKAGLSEMKRKELLQCYLDELSQYITVDRADFTAHFYGFVLIRILQAMGAYGYRGILERKPHFVLSIPHAIQNLKYLLEKNMIKLELPELKNVLMELVRIDWQKRLNITEHLEKSNTLNVLVTSFSYKKGVPQDYSGNGGGFVFDCRALPNPGREAQYQTMTGKDQEVVDYLEDFTEVHAFKNYVFELVDASVDNYLLRKFSHLMVSFGCTGGQHRSAYFAEQMAAHLRKEYPQINVILQHTNI